MNEDTNTMENAAEGAVDTIKKESGSMLESAESTWISIQDSVLEVWKGFQPYLWAIILFTVGYFIAKTLAGALRKLLHKTDLDNKIASWVGLDTGGSEKFLSRIFFYFLMLFVLVFSLDAAGLSEEVSEPIRKLLGEITGAIPNIIKAGLLLFVAVLIARVVKMVLANILGACRVDERLGSKEGTPITTAIATGVYFFIILVFLPGILDALKMSSVSDPISNLVHQIIDYLPKLLVGGIIFAIGFLLAKIVRQVLSNFLVAVNFDSLPAKLGYAGPVGQGGKSPTAIVSYIAMIAIIVIAATEALTQMELGTISEAADKLRSGFFNILGGLIILGIGIFFANIISHALSNRGTKIATIAKWSIIIFTAIVAFQVADFSEFSNEAFQTLYSWLIIAAATALGLGGALAIGLGLGWKNDSSVAKLFDKKFDN